MDLRAAAIVALEVAKSDDRKPLRQRLRPPFAFPVPMPPPVEGGLLISTTSI
jgi:hypothetical protein